jgi:hypothetical protein
VRVQPEGGRDVRVAQPLAHDLDRDPGLQESRGVMRRDRERLGLRECRAAWLLGLTVREYRELVMPDLWERMVEVFEWPKACPR